MIPSLKPYPGMKDSGVAWLGEVPEHWHTDRVKTLLRERDQRSGTGDGVLLSLTRARGLLPHSEASNRMASADNLSKYKVCKPGDLVMNRMQAWSGMFAAADIQGLVSPDYSVFVPVKPLNAKYFEHLFKTPLLVDQFAQRSKGIGSGFNRLYTPDFGAVPVAFPEVAEQSAIVRFLSYSDRRIARYIQAKRRLIVLLNEQRLAIIFRTVSLGLDPNVHLKPSGRGWLSDVPEHWKVLQVRRVVRTVTSGSRGWAAFYSDDGDIFLQSGNLGRSMSLNLSTIQYVQPPPGSEGIRTKVRRDDVLICITGALTGNVVLVETDLPSAYVNQHVALVRPKQSEVLPKFLAYCLHSRVGQGQFKATEYGGTKQGLGLDEVKSVVVPIPPRDEQEAIVKMLDQQLSTLGVAIDRALREIALVREYRTRLNADVVTGKLDVREAAADLPEEPKETVALDEAEVLEGEETDDALEAVEVEAEA